MRAGPSGAWEAWARSDTSALAFADLAQHYLMRANVTAIRRVRKTDNNRIAR